MPAGGCRQQSYSYVSQVLLSLLVLVFSYSCMKCVFYETNLVTCPYNIMTLLLFSNEKNALNQRAWNFLLVL